ACHQRSPRWLPGRAQRRSRQLEHPIDRRGRHRRRHGSGGRRGRGRRPRHRGHVPSREERGVEARAGPHVSGDGARLREGRGHRPRVPAGDRRWVRAEGARTRARDRRRSRGDGGAASGCARSARDAVRLVSLVGMPWRGNGANGTPRRRALCAVLVGIALALGCEGEARVPVELDLAAFGLTLGDWTPRSIVVEAVGPRRRIVQVPGDAFELFVRLPFEARLRFTLDPRTPDDAFAVSVGAGSTMTALRPRRVGEGDWESTVDGSEPGGIVRLRFENRGALPLAWWEPRLTGTARPLAPVIGLAVRPPAGPLNVILLVSDALRADHLALYGYRRPTTPELARLALQHGVVFEHAYAAGPSTPNSIPSLFTSRHPSAVGVSFPAAPGRTDRTLAEAFSLAGTRTAAFVGNPLLMPEL